MAESEIVASLQQVLPEQFQQLIPSELRNVAPQSPAVAQQQAQEAFYEEPPLSAEQLSICQSGTQLQQHRLVAGLAIDAVIKAIDAFIRPIDAFIRPIDAFIRPMQALVHCWPSQEWPYIMSTLFITRSEWTLLQPYRASVSALPFGGTLRVSVHMCLHLCVSITVVCWRYAQLTSLNCNNSKESKKAKWEFTRAKVR